MWYNAEQLHVHLGYRSITHSLSLTTIHTPAAKKQRCRFLTEGRPQTIRNSPIRHRFPTIHRSRGQNYHCYFAYCSDGAKVQARLLNYDKELKKELTYCISLYAYYSYHARALAH